MKKNERNPNEGTTTKFLALTITSRKQGKPRVHTPLIHSVSYSEDGKYFQFVAIHDEESQCFPARTKVDIQLVTRIQGKVFKKEFKNLTAETAQISMLDRAYSSATQTFRKSRD